MKRLLAVITLCLMAIGLIFPVAALASATAPSAYLVDDAGVLTDDERSALETKLSQNSAKYNTMIIALLTSKTGIDPNAGDYEYQLQDFSDEYLRGLVSSTGKQEAVLLTIDVSGRGYHISTHGDAIYSFTDNGIQAIGQELAGTPDNPGPLRQSDWYGATDLYADLAGGMIEYRNNNGVAYGQTVENGQNAQEGAVEDKHLPVKGLVGVGIGLLGSFGITGSMKKKLKTVEKKASAAGYFDPAQLKLRAQNDTFLYVNVTRVPIRTEPPKGGGGFSTHTSSGGGTFGGGGGRF